VSAHDQIRLIHRTAIEERDLHRIARIREVDDRDSALVPRLHEDVPPRYRYQGAVVRHAVLLLGLRRRHLDVAAKLELTVDDVEYRVRTPVLWVGRAAARTRAAAPFVGENDLCAVVAERRGVPVREARID